ncbi:PREDICTED: cold shock domain-containing protein 4 [Tarenaya hassleriana]|uniref:cold shock domain-containing protein 4 n=1 Tax=Tarenaya hassleriana TaxID=28532 RepID=UPI00053C8D16|nr:PREDICTED: cold shock domain-containing protein 4 [Tarenaya hassleriana]
MPTKLNSFVFIFATLLLLTLELSHTLATRPDSSSKKGNGGYYGPGSEPGFSIPGFGSGWGNGIIGGGYGGGYGGPKGGYGKGGVVRPKVVCKEKGPCFMKTLQCPAKCFKSFSRSGKGYGGGGGGGGCTIDCKSKCIAYC